jgi:uncharacterized membrane protein
LTIQLNLYVREGHPACREARGWAESLQAEYPLVFELRDVDSSPAWREAYGADVPVAEVNGRRLKTPLTLDELKSALAVAKAIGDYQKETAVPNSVHKVSKSIDRFAEWLSRHWLAVFNGFVAIYLGLALLAPVLMKVGATTPASWIYSVYSATCHQLGFRSFYLFGQKPYYPRAEFAADTGIDPNDLWAARAFRGNSLLGYKVALCERDVAIYSGFILAGIFFYFFRKKIKPLHWILWILIGIAPIAVDGGSQLLSYLPFISFPPRESTPLLRALTGLLFGVTSVWFAYPYMEESLEEDAAASPTARR